MITDYDSLVATVSGHLNRDDLADIIPGFIASAEEDLNHQVRHYRMKNNLLEFELQGRFTPLPSDWVETISIEFNGVFSRPLELIGNSEFSFKRQTRSTVTGADPCYYRHTTLEGVPQVELYPVPKVGDTVTLEYYQKIPSLLTQPTNWLLEESPNAYLYTSLSHAATYLDEADGLGGTWIVLRQEAIDRLNSSGRDAELSGANLQMKVRGLDPKSVRRNIVQYNY